MLGLLSMMNFLQTFHFYQSANNVGSTRGVVPRTLLSISSPHSLINPSLALFYYHQRRNFEGDPGQHHNFEECMVTVKALLQLPGM